MAHMRLTALVAAAALTAMAGGCRENEQNRPLEFKPGVYQGQKSPTLNDQQNRELRERGNLLRPPHSKALGDGLFELRSVKHALRVFYMFLPGQQIVLLDGS